MIQPSLETLTQRLDRLEQEMRWWKLAGAIVLLGASAVVLMGQAMPFPRTVEARGFAAVDVNGKPRLLMGLGSDGSPTVTLMDRDEKPRVILAVLPDGSPALGFYDQSGKERAALKVLAKHDGAPFLILNDKEGKIRAAVTVNAEGSPGLALRNEDGKIIWKVP